VGELGAGGTGRPRLLGAFTSYIDVKAPSTLTAREIHRFPTQPQLKFVRALTAGPAPP
jgi:hypothetical protein